MRKISLILAKNKSAKAFLWLALGALGTSLSIFLRNYIIYSQYDKPPDLLFIPLLFEYSAFSFVAFLFPWSWKKYKGNRSKQLFSSIATCLIFVLVYVFTLNALDWFARGREYDLFVSFQFTALHTSLFAIVIYTIISVILFRLGIVDADTGHDREWIRRIPYRIRNETFYIPIDQVQFFESDGNYIKVHTDQAERILIRKTLRRLEQELDPEKFCRIHRRRLVSLEKIISYRTDSNGGYKLFLKENKELKVSRSYQERIRPLLRKP